MVSCPYTVTLCPASQWSHCPSSGRCSYARSPVFQSRQMTFFPGSLTHFFTHTRAHTHSLSLSLCFSPSALSPVFDFTPALTVFSLSSEARLLFRTTSLSSLLCVCFCVCESGLLHFLQRHTLWCKPVFCFCIFHFSSCVINLIPCCQHCMLLIKPHNNAILHSLHKCKFIVMLNVPNVVL